MILELIGFLIVCLVGIFLSFYSLLFFLVGGLMGDNIGGRPATFVEKVIMISIILMTILLWYWVYNICPFNINYKN